MTSCMGTRLLFQPNSCAIDGLENVEKMVTNFLTSGLS